MQNGFVTRDRTTLIASTHRIYTVAEKMHMGDGRFDSEVVLKAARALAKRAILFDMQAHANAASTVISAVMFGALAGSGTLPLSRGDCEAAIRSGGKGAEASLKVLRRASMPQPDRRRVGTVTSAEKKRLSGSERVRQTFPEETRAMLEEGAGALRRFSGPRLREALPGPPRADRESRPRCRRIQAHQRNRAFSRPVDVLRRRDSRRRPEDAQEAASSACARKCRRSRTSRCTSSRS